MFEERKIYAEFLAEKYVLLATPYTQKKVHLNDNITMVDLMSMKLIEEPDVAFDTCLTEPPSPFFMVFMYDEVDKCYLGEVLAQVGDEELSGIGVVNLREKNKKSFKEKVWVDR